MKEAHRNSEITGIETFSHFVHNYLSEIAANPPRQRIFAHGNWKGIFSGIDEAYRPYEELEQKFSTMNGWRVELENCEWSSTPKSLKTILTSHFESAKLDDEKKVNVSLLKHCLTFYVKSPLIINGHDMYAEKFYDTGVRLWLLDTTGDRRRKANEGTWFSRKKTPEMMLLEKEIIERFNQGSQEEEAHDVTPNEEKLYELAKSCTAHLHATVDELDDIAKFLQANESNAVLYKVLDK